MKQRLSPQHPRSGNTTATSQRWCCWVDVQCVLLALWCGVVAATAQLVVARVWW